MAIQGLSRPASDNRAVNFWRLHRSHHPRLAWLAWLALVTVAVLPTISRALVPLAPSQFIADLCRSSDTVPAHEALTACAACVVAATPMLPPAPWSAGVVPQQTAAWLTPGHAPAQARTLRATAQARAPPALG
jgi:hypothetical protein